MPHTSPERCQAFEHLHYFLSGAFSTVLRQLNCWKGLSSHRHPDLVDDLVQKSSWTAWRTPTSSCR